MDLIEWNESMSVQISEIDQQHQYLIKLLNELFESIIEGKVDQILNNVVDGLMEYSKFHFSTEENYFDRFQYSGAKDHKLAHVFFVDEIANFKKQLHEDRTTLSIELFNFLKDWLTDHILVMDAKYAKFLSNHGFN